MTTVGAAINRREDAAVPGTVTIVAVDAPMRADAYWTAQMLAIWAPVAVWAVVEATRKPEDLEPWLARLPQVVTLVVQDTDLSADPAAVLRRVDAPVALIDGARATPHRWASLLGERLENPQHEPVPLERPPRRVRAGRPRSRARAPRRSHDRGDGDPSAAVSRGGWGAVALLRSATTPPTPARTAKPPRPPVTLPSVSEADEDSSPP